MLVATAPLVASVNARDLEHARVVSYLQESRDLFILYEGYLIWLSPYRNDHPSTGSLHEAEIGASPPTNLPFSSSRRTGGSFCRYEQ